MIASCAAFVLAFFHLGFAFIPPSSPLSGRQGTCNKRTYDSNSSLRIFDNESRRIGILNGNLAPRTFALASSLSSQPGSARRAGEGKLVKLKNKLFSLLKLLLMGYDKNEELEQVRYEQSMRAFSLRITAAKEAALPPNEEMEVESKSLNIEDLSFERPTEPTLFDTFQPKEVDMMASLKRRIEQLKSENLDQQVFEVSAQEPLLQVVNSESHDLLEINLDEDEIEIEPKLANPADVERLKRLFGSH